MSDESIPNPLTLDDLPFLPDPEELSPGDLRVLLARLDELYDSLSAAEPEWTEEEAEAEEEWTEQLEEIDDLMDDIRDLLEEN